MADEPQMVPVISPSGQFGTVAKTDLPAAIGSGFRLASSEEQSAASEQAQYGNRPVAAFLAGAARGATFGLSDLALSKLKFGDEPIVNPETLAGIEKHNPEASTGGEWVSILGPGLGALGAFGKGGKLAAKTLGAGVEGANALGSAVKAGASAAAKAVGADEASMLGRIATSHIPRALGLSAEAELYNIGHNLSKAVLENEDLTAESLLANSENALEVGAAFGLGAPAMLRLGRELFDHAVPEVIKSAPSKAGSMVYDRVAKFFDPDRLTGLYSGAGGRSALLLDTVKGRKFIDGFRGLRREGFFRPGEVIDDLESGGFKQVAKGPLPTREQSYKRLQDGLNTREQAKRDIFADIDNALSADVEGGAQSPWRVGSATEAKQVAAFQSKLKSEMMDLEPKAVQQIRDKIAKWRSNRVITEQEAGVLDPETGKYTPGSLNARIDDVRGGVKEKAGSFSALNEMKVDLQKGVGPKGYGSPVTDQAKLVDKDLVRLIKENIEAGTEMVKNETRYRGLANQIASIKKLNQVEAWLLAIKEPLDSAIKKAEANANIGGLRWRDGMMSAFGSVLGGSIAGPAGAAAGLALGYIQKYLQDDAGLLLRARIGEELGALVGANHALSNARAVLAGGAKQFVTGNVEPAVHKILPRVLGKLSADHAEKHVAMAGVSPEQLADDMGNHSPTARLISPTIADKLTMKRLKAVMQLKTLQPKNPAQQLYLNPLQAVHGASQADRLRYQRQKRAAAQPLSVVDDLLKGRLHKDTLAVTQTLYPSLVEELKKHVVEAVAAHGKPLPASKMAQLGLLFNVPIDPSLQPEIMRGLASIGTQQAPQKDIGQPSPKGGARQAGALKMKAESGKTVSEHLLA